MNTTISNALPVEVRPETGKGEARKLRATGKAPGVIYADGEPATPVAFDSKQLLEVFRKSQNRNTVLTLQLDGTEIPAIVKEAQRHPVSRALLHVDFYAVKAEKPVELMIPVRSVGRPAAANVGGRIRLIRRVLRARVPFDKIPQFLDVDVTPMQIGDMFTAQQIQDTLPEYVELVFDNDFNVVSCYGKKRSATPKQD